MKLNLLFTREQRSLLFLSCPRLWPTWPFLPVVRRSRGITELGVLVDLQSVTGRLGFRSTVFRSNLFLVPRTEAELLRLPREVYDTPEELIAAGWEID